MPCTGQGPLYRATRSAMLLLALVLPASGPAQPTQDSASDPMAGLRALIDDAACITDNQCRTIAIGTSACGGPERYLAWSTLRSDEADLRRAASAYPSDRLSAARRGGAYSTCRPLSDPGAQCTTMTGAADKHSCTLRSASPGAASMPQR
jgi:hypothetical protein